MTRSRSTSGQRPRSGAPAPAMRPLRSQCRAARLDSLPSPLRSAPCHWSHQQFVRKSPPRSALRHPRSPTRRDLAMSLPLCWSSRLLRGAWALSRSCGALQQASASASAAASGGLARCVEQRARRASRSFVAAACQPAAEQAAKPAHTTTAPASVPSAPRRRRATSPALGASAARGRASRNRQRHRTAMRTPLTAARDSK